jgi:hypothetical protein
VDSLSDDPQDPQMQSSEYCQGSFSPFWQFFTSFRAGVIWWTPRSQSSIKQGLSRILFTILSLFFANFECNS